MTPSRIFENHWIARRLRGRPLARRTRLWRPTARSMVCELGQGYLFGRPTDVASFGSLLAGVTAADGLSRAGGDVIPIARRRATG